jgi:hypothetical protein
MQPGSRLGPYEVVARLGAGFLRRIALLFALRLLAAGSARAAPAIPVITEPATENQVISAYDVHMVTGPFLGAPGESHVCSDWEIRTISSGEAVWTASCVTGTLKIQFARERQAHLRVRVRCRRESDERPFPVDRIHRHGPRLGRGAGGWS